MPRPLLHYPSCVTFVASTLIPIDRSTRRLLLSIYWLFLTKWLFSAMVRLCRNRHCMDANLHLVLFRMANPIIQNHSRTKRKAFPISSVFGWAAIPCMGHILGRWPNLKDGVVWRAGVEPAMPAWRANSISFYRGHFILIRSCNFGFQLPPFNMFSHLLSSRRTY